MSRASPERSVQVALVRWLRLVLPAGSIVAAIENERAAKSVDPMAQARFQLRRRASGVMSGFPDLVILLPGGRTILCEVKAPANGVVSEAQDGLHTRLRSMGFEVFVANSIETARGPLRALGIPLREATGQMVAVAKVRTAKPRLRVPADVVPL